MLAPLYAVFGLDMLALKTVGVGSFALFLVVLWVTVRRHHSSAVALACVGLCAFNPSFLRATDQIVSDVPFLFFSCLSVLLIGIVIVERHHVIGPAWDHMALGGVVALAFLVRTNGILLLVTIAVSQAIAALTSSAATVRDVDLASPRVPRRGRVLAIATLPYVGFAVPTLALTTILPEGGYSHVDHLQDVTVSTLARQVSYYIELPARFFEGVPHERIVFGATIPLAAVGLAARLRSHYHVVIYIVLTTTLYIVWPHQAGLRLLFPLLPFYLLFLLASVDRANDAAPPEHRRWARAVVLLSALGIVLLFAALSTTRAMDNLSRDRAAPVGPYLPTSQDMFSFIRAQTPADSTIVFFKPRVMRLFGERRSVRVTRIEQLGRGDYLCVYRAPTDTSHQLAPGDVDRAVARGQLRRVYENADFTLYRVNESDGGMP
jgi:hypothetical protein